MEKTGTADSNLLTIVRTTLLSKKIEPNARNIANACFETINRISSRGKQDFSDLLNAVATAGLFAVTETSLKALSNSIEGNSLIWCKILKEFFRTGDSNGILELLVALAKNIKLKGISSLVSKSFKIEEILNSSDAETAASVLESCMDACIKKVEVIEFLEADLVRSVSTERVNRILLEYLRIKSSKLERIAPKEVGRISKLVAPIQQGSLEILIHLLTFYKNNVLISKVKRDGPIESIFTKSFVEIVRNEVIEGNHTDAELVPLLSLLSEDLLPAFSPLLVEINSIFLSEGKFQKILQNLISYISIIEFSEITGPICISKHSQVIRGLSNIDLSIFLAMYWFYSSRSPSGVKNNINSGINNQQNTESQDECIACVPEDGLPYLLPCLPSLCYYCTDHSNNISSLIRILEYHIDTHPSIVASSIERLIYSHSNNLNSLLSLKSPIPREQSSTILSLLSKSSLLQSLLQKFIESETFDCEDALKPLIRLCGYDLSSQVIPVILGTATPGTLSLNSALRLMVFFVPNNLFGIDFISRLVELCGGVELGTQKKAYRLLHEIYALRRTTVCICDILYNTLSRTAKEEKYRLLLLSKTKGCGCDTDKKDKFVTEVVRGLAIGNVKCRKTAKELVLEMEESEIEHLFKYVFGKRKDTEIMCGCVEAGRVLVEHGRNVKRSVAFEMILEIAGHSLQVAKHVMWAFNSFMESCISESDDEREMIKEDEIESRAAKATDEFYRGMAKVVDGYISQFSKKMNSELKEFCIKAKSKGEVLTRSMKTLLKFRNKGGRGQEVQMVEKVEFNELL